MKTQLLKKLFAFISLAIEIFFFSAAPAQIVYTDVNPDIIITPGGTYNLDLNNDGVNDFIFTTDSSTIFCFNNYGFSSGPYINAAIQPTYLNDIALSSVLGERICQNFSLDSLIDSSLAYSSTSVILAHKGKCIKGGYCVCLHGQEEPWNVGLNAYAGLIIQINGQNYYGWVQLDVEKAGGRVTIQDYAYNSIPNQSILAGDSGSIATNIHHIKSFSSLAISPNSFQHLTRISFSLHQPEKTTVVIYDVTGRIVKILANEMMSAGNHQLQWNATDERGDAVSEGIYFLKVEASSEVETKELSVIK